MKPYSQLWERAANRLARGYAPQIYPCAKCSYPVLYRYTCTNCGDSNPTEPAVKTEEKEPCEETTKSQS